MPNETIHIRFAPAVLYDLDCLAASNGGNRSAAVREAVQQFRAAVEAAARANAADLTEAEWTTLGHLNDPDDGLADLLDEPRPAEDWSRRLAVELAQSWSGREILLPEHRAEAETARGLARRVASWGPVRGYALMAALRYFWRHPEAGIAACAAPEVWLTPTARREDR